MVFDYLFRSWWFVFNFFLVAMCFFNLMLPMLCSLNLMFYCFVWFGCVVICVVVTNAVVTITHTQKQQQQSEAYECERHVQITKNTQTFHLFKKINNTHSQNNTQHVKRNNNQSIHVKPNVTPHHENQTANYKKYTTRIAFIKERHWQKQTVTSHYRPVNYWL